MLQDIADTDWILRPEVQPALIAMTQCGLRFDALIQPRHLPNCCRYSCSAIRTCRS
jgi:L-fuconolactonase